MGESSSSLFAEEHDCLAMKAAADTLATRSHVEAGLNTSRRGSHIESVPADPNHLHLSDDVIRRASVVNPDFGGLTADSKDATNHETTMSVAQGIKLYKKGIGWSLLLSTVLRRLNGR